jgi:hypothetical protein
MTTTPQPDPSQPPDTADDLLTPMAPVIEAVLRVIPTSHAAMENRLRGLPDPAPKRAIEEAIVAVLRNLSWREQGVQRITEALTDLQRKGVIPGGSPDQPPAEPGTVPPARGEWRPRCQWCGEPCRTVNARFCKQAHRQAAYEQRKRDKLAKTTP